MINRNIQKVIMILVVSPYDSDYLSFTVYYFNELLPKKIKKIKKIKGNMKQVKIYLNETRDHVRPIRLE